MSRIALALLLALLTAAPPAPARNALYGNPSPYLGMHGEDPVHWLPWGPEALDRARREQRLLFVSVGYFACYWCHVMHEESFRDPAIARLLNEHFVPVKVDREVDPALDARLMAFTEATAGRGGWPLNVFLTPEGYPLAGMTYLPRDRFAAVLRKLQARWQRDAEGLRRAARAFSAELAKRREADERPLPGRHIHELGPALRFQLLDYADDLQGGFGHQAKFPSVPQLMGLLALRRPGGKPDEEVTRQLRLTLDHMAAGGLRDHIGDGFFRYTVDPDWETPHFEKMLYTNALLAWFYLRAGEALDAPGYTDIGLRTLRFLQRDMDAGDGLFVASLSAVDERGEEGGYYHWTWDELRRLLAEDDLTFADAAWHLQGAGEGRPVLPRQNMDLAALAKAFDLDEPAAARRLQRIRDTLRAARARRHRLPRDEKRLAGWNGLALAAFAAALPRAPALRARGQRLFDALRERLWRGDHLLRGRAADGRPLGRGQLDDYAGVAWGVLQWARASGDKGAWRFGERVLRAAWRRFHGPRGWRRTERSLLPDPLWQRHLPDGPIPSGEALLWRATALWLGHRPDPALQSALAALDASPTQAVEEQAWAYAALIASAIEYPAEIRDKGAAKADRP